MMTRERRVKLTQSMAAAVISAMKAWSDENVDQTEMSPVEFLYVNLDALDAVSHSMREVAPEKLGVVVMEKPR